MVDVILRGQRRDRVERRVNRVSPDIDALLENIADGDQKKAG